MAESYSVKAVLSAVDRGFSSTFKDCYRALDNINSKVSGLAFGVMAGVGQAAFNTVTNSARDLVSELDSSNASWKTFSKNMEMLGKDSKEINKVTKELQKYAEQTVYSSSDMATTFAQLEAVGVKGTTNLVKGFGGLAAAAENPQQAMKTLSTQATQMAAKPTVAWADFKLMLEQTPAGIAAVAKQMGMTTSELVSSVQEGSVKTQDFFDAIKEVGTSDAFTELATEAKTVGQAVDGLKESLSNKLNPAFELMTQVGISAVDSISGALGKVNFDNFTKKIEKAIETAQRCGDVFKFAFKGVGTEFNKAKNAVAFALEGVNDALGSTTPPVQLFKQAIQKVAASLTKVFQFVQKNAPTFRKAIAEGVKIAKGIWDSFSASAQKVGGAVMDLIGFILANSDVFMSILGAGVAAVKPYWDAFVNVVTFLVGVLKSAAAVIVEHAETIKTLIPWVLGAVAAFKGFQIVQTFLPFLSGFATKLGSMAKTLAGGLADKLFGVSKAQDSVGKSSATSGKDMIQSATAMLIMAAAVAVIAVGFAVLAQSAIALANSGGAAIAVMGGMVVAIAALGAGMVLVLQTLAPMGAQLMPVATAMLAMGAAVVLVAAGFAVMATASIALAEAGTPAILIMGGMVVALALLAVGAAALGPALTAGSAGLLAFGATILMVGAGMALMGAAALLAANALVIISDVLPALAEHGVQGALAIVTLSASLAYFAIGAGAAGAACIVLGAGLLLIGAALVTAGAGMLLLGTGTLLAATALTMVAEILPIITEYGNTGAVAIALLGAGMLAFAAGATAAGAGSVVLTAGIVALAAGIVVASAAIIVLAAGILTLTAGVLALSVGVVALGASLLVVAAAFALMAGLIPSVTVNTIALTAALTGLVAVGVLLAAELALLNAPLLLVSASALAASVSMLAFGVSMTTGAAGTLLMAAALVAVTAEMVIIAEKAKRAEKSLKQMTESINLVEEGLDALESKAKDAMDKLKNAFDTTAKESEKSGKAVGENFNKGMETELNKAPMIATKAVVLVNTLLQSGHGGAYTAGAYISQGFAAGMQSCLGAIQSAAAAMVAAAEAAIRAKAMIHSPSRLTEQLGNYFGEGFEVGITDMFGAVKRASEKLVAIPQVQTPQLAFAGGYSHELSDDFEYTRNSQYTIEVPLNVDGREFAKATASYTEEELNRKQSRDYRKQGRI